MIEIMSIQYNDITTIRSTKIVMHIDVIIDGEDRQRIRNLDTLDRVRVVIDDDKELKQ